MKRIVICSDGTWNRPEKDPDDVPTNVLDTARGIVPVGPDGVVQVVFYDWGIGSYHNKLTGGAFAAGLDKNIVDAYRFIVHNYDPGDAIYLFGFSRGAYTIRSLCGMIRQCGVLKRSRGGAIYKAYALYREPSEHPDSEKSKRFRKANSHADRTPIRFVGAYDTVGALGLPFEALKFLEGGRYEFHDTQLSSIVQSSRHALSIDEKRDDFQPTLWSYKAGMDLMQVWFPGGHSDVGGGYKPDSDRRLLSRIPRQWMSAEAGKCGLTLDRRLTTLGDNDHLATLHDEYKSFAKLLGSHQRTIPTRTWLHQSVKDRHDAPRMKYAPPGLKAFLKSKGGWPATLVPYAS